MIAAWVAAQIGLEVAAVLAAGHRPVCSAAAGLFVAAGAAVALHSPPDPMLRCCLALIVLCAFLGAIRFSFSRRVVPWRRRLWQIVSLFDVDRARPVQPSFSWPLLWSTVRSGAQVWLSLLGLSALGGLSAPVFAVARLTLGVTLVYGVMGFLSEAPRLVYLSCGIEVPQNQCAPILSRSAAEFWGRRWNRFVSALLSDLVFRPLARHGGSAFALLATFLASAALHAWLALVSLGWTASFQMGTYFVVEGFIVLAERRLSLRSWPTPVARLWTVLVVVGPSPYAFDVFFRAFGL